MAKYEWKFANVGGNSRVRIESGEDIMHLDELDLKMWTVLSCPTVGLEIDNQSLALMDIDGDGRVKVHEVIATSKWLCEKLVSADILLEGKDELKLDQIADEQIREIAKEVAGDKDSVSLADVDAAIGSVSVENQPLPDAPFGADTDMIIGAYNQSKEAYDSYFKDLKMQQLGLVTIAEDRVVPKISEQDWNEYGAKIAEYQAATAAVNGANADALAAATAQYQPLRKLLLLSRDFYTLLKNYITFEDFYDRSKKAIFQVGTLVIDQRMCDFCMRVEDMSKHDMQASASGMYLLYCDCLNRKSGATMKIVASVTQGDVHNLMVGKNAIFYDRSGEVWDAVVVKIVDNPISIKQAFFSPYRKMSNWVRELIDKHAAEKETSGFEDMKAKATVMAVNAKENAANGEKQQNAFDIAKFAGIFAAFGMAIGMIGGFITGIGKGIAALDWWQLILAIIGILLAISGPSMFIAWLKLRRRNIGPLLNANGWAINAEAIINVPFGISLTSQAQFPFLGKRMPKWQKWLIGAAAGIVFMVVVWLCNGLSWAKLPSPIKSDEVQIEQVVEPQAVEVMPVETVEE